MCTPVKSLFVCGVCVCVRACVRVRVCQYNTAVNQDIFVHLQPPQWLNSLTIVLLCDSIIYFITLIYSRRIMMYHRDLFTKDCYHQNRLNLNQFIPVLLPSESYLIEAQWHICVIKKWLSLLQEMACHLFVTKPLPMPVCVDLLSIRSLGPKRSGKFEWKFKTKSFKKMHL